jgi:hypothetical protein
VFAKARADGLLFEELPGETLVYDQVRDEAHCLNALAAAVFRAADGSRGVKELSELVSERMGRTVSVGDVEEALAELAANHLLMEDPVVHRGFSRRQVLAAGGSTLAAGALVSTIVAPVPAQAQSPTCVPAQGTCASSSQCCTPLQCNNGKCCSAAGAVCSTNTDCCSGFACINGACGIG